MKRHLFWLALLGLFVTPALAVLPQAIALPGLYTIAPGPDNLEANLPAVAYCQYIAWAIDRPGGAGYMVSDCTSTPVWTANAGPAGPPGANGTNGNTILSGTGAPAGGLGVNGDFYVDVVVPRMYGPKTSGIWGTGVPLIGPAGPNGNAATVAVGSVTTGSPGSSAAVANAGTSQAAILNFTIPRGDVGATGGTGATGSTGPAGPSTIGAPTSRSLSLATAYQCTDNTKPCLVSVTINSTVSFSLSGTVTNTAALLVGATNAVASGTGSVVGNYLNSVGGTIVIGLTLNNQATQSYTLAVPAGYWFAVRQTAGTVSITSAFDQSLG